MIPNFKFNFKKNINFNFDGGDLSSDSGIFLFHDFVNQFDFKKIVDSLFNISGDKAKRIHSNTSLLFQYIYMTVLGYHHQEQYNDLRYDPALMACFDGKELASQPSASRFVSRLTEETFNQLEKINETLIDSYFALNVPEYMIIDIDTTNLQGFGEQEGLSFNAHYGEHGLSALMAFDDATGLFLKGKLRPGTTHCSNGVADFLRPLLKRNKEKYGKISSLVRGDAGFSSPEVYAVCEEFDAKYLIRLKANNKLFEAAEEISMQVFGTEIKFENRYLVSEFEYKAASWDKPRRVIVEIERKAGEMFSHYSYYVTNLNEHRPSLILKLYKKRGNMENYIKEAKHGFALDKISQKSLIANQNQMMIKMLAYNLIKCFSSLVLPKKMRSFLVGRIRNRFFKVASRRIKTSGQTTFKFASSYPLKQSFMIILNNIFNLKKIE